MNTTNQESLAAWEANAEFWDRYMGDESNFFHCDMVRPYTEELLDVKEGEFILDIACGNGNFSERMAQRGAMVVAIDYSPRMVELAKKRRTKFAKNIEFAVCDATSKCEILRIARDRKFDKAVANMALMDISDIGPLFSSLTELLKPSGVFVFSMHHPCFTAPNSNYLSAQTHKGIAVEGQPVEQNYYHRPLQEIFGLAFRNGFVIDGFHEVPFEGESEPIIIIVRVKKSSLHKICTDTDGKQYE